MKIEKAFWLDHKPTDNNNGYLYGIYYIDNEDKTDPTEIVHTEWFKTKKKRDSLFDKEIKKKMEQIDYEKDFIIDYMIIKTKEKPKCEGWTCYFIPDHTYLYDDEGNNAWETKEQAENIRDTFEY